MDRVAQWPSSERSALFRETAARRGMVPAIIEKDFWVCWILGRLFADDFFREKIMFKGGTSLSKIFKAIERFSEDIDLALDWNVVATESPFSDRSKKGQRRFNEAARSAARQYLREQFLPRIQELLSGICDASIDENTPNVIDVSYPAAFGERYILPRILLEVGPFAAWNPNAEYDVIPYAAEEFPKQFMNSACKVWAIKAERTFWEKVTILHHEAHRPEGRPVPERHSRHYYDIVVMARSSIKTMALSDLDLLTDVVEFKQRFFPRGWARYDLAKPNTLKLVPPRHVSNSLRSDYRDMQVMIYGESPRWEEVMAALSDLETEINELG